LVYRDERAVEASRLGRLPTALQEHGKMVSHRRRIEAVIAVVLGLALLSPAQPPRISPSDVPTFKLRARVTSVAHNGVGDVSFSYQWFPPRDSEVHSLANLWSPWLTYTIEDAKRGLLAYPMNGWHQFPMIVKLRLSPVTDPTDIDVELTFDGESRAFRMTAELFGPDLGIMVWRDQAGRPQAATMAQYNRRYWPAFDAASVGRQRPSRFILADQFDGADDDYFDWSEGVRHVAKTGINTLRLDATAALRRIAVDAGIRRFATGAGGIIIGDELGYKPVNETPAHWAQRLAQAYYDAGYQRGEIATFALADEPGWYFPDSYRALEKDADRLRDFHAYLAANHLTPGELGKNAWEDVRTLGVSGAGPTSSLDARRLFYWTARYFSWHSANYFAQVTRDLKSEFGNSLEVYTNWNNFSGSLYFDIPVRTDYPSSPDKGAGAHDWSEFGRLHGTNMLWTEDWFGPPRAYQWSYYCSRLGSIASANGLRFGGYMVPSVNPEPLYGVLQKALSIVGGGGKAIEYYTFGPEYSFPGNCYSEVPGVEQPIAQANRMIAAAEDVLWPGKRPRAQIAILQPRSSDIWDRRHLSPTQPVAGSTNSYLNERNVDYMAESFDAYLALQLANVPADFMDEDDLTSSRLASYKVLYITEPDIPSDAQVALREWVKRGGTLVMVPGAAQADRYDEPVTILTSLIDAPPYRRTFMMGPHWNETALEALPPAGKLLGQPVFGSRVALEVGPDARSFFDDHSVAVLERRIGAGRIVYFAWFPGISFAKSVLGHDYWLIPAASKSISQQWILYPVRSAHIEPPVLVDKPLVETPFLLSPSGAAVTLLNWSGSQQESVKVTVRVPFPVRSAMSSIRGTIPFVQNGGNVNFSIPLGPADIVAFRP
jgi:hypothetical protein